MSKHWILTGALLALCSTTAMAQGRGHGRGGTPPGQAKKAEREAQPEVRFADHDRELVRNWWTHEQRGDAREGGEDREADRGRGNQGRGLPPGLQRRELPPGLRDRDRLPPGLERKLAPGYVLTTDDRRILFPAPVVLVRGFAPAPPGFHYFAFGRHIVLVDGGWRLHDVIHLEAEAGN